MEAAFAAPPMDQNPTKESRPPINLRIKFRSENVEQFIERYAVDVSRGGIFIRTREPLAVGTQLKLDFQFQNGSALMSGEGTVVWIREFDPNRTTVPPGMGVRFDKLSPESQAVLEQLLVEKAKRERGGVPGSAGHAGGGMAVRRPSSMFSALEPQVSVAEGTASDKPAASATAAGTNAPATSGPSLVEKLAAKPGASKVESKSEAAYRPLGTAKNPFSGTPAPTPTTPSSSPDAPPASSSGGGPRPLSELLPLFAGGGKTSPAAASPPTRHEAAAADGGGFDDLNEEPTQIAGRLPSFLSSDDDATTEVPADLAQAVKTAAPLPADFLPGASPDSLRPGARAKQSLDEAPPKAKETTAETAEAPATPAVVTAAKTESAAALPVATAAATAPKPAEPPAKKRSAAPVVVAVVVLGASAIFLYKFFGANTTENVATAPSSAGIPAAATGEPSALSPPPTPPAAAPTGEPTAPAVPAAAAPPPAEPPAPAAEPKPAAPVAAAAEDPAAEGTTKKTKKKTKPASTVAAAEPAAVPAAAPTAGAGTTTTTPEASDPAGVVHQVKVTSKPVGADVLLDGQNVGATPFSVGVADINAPHSIIVRKDGFEPFEQMIGPSSAWSKAKGSKGKPGLSVLKLNARLKPMGGAGPAEGRGATEPPASGDAPAKTDAPKTEAPKVERPLPPTDQPSPPGEGQ
jgi:molecular chaperone DnaK